MPIFTYTIPASELAAAPSVGTAPLAHETDHQAVARSLFIWPLRDKPRIDAFSNALHFWTQKAEDLAWDCLTERSLDAVEGAGPAVGVQLDKIGTILQLLRGELSDDEYRVFLKAKARVLRSRGRVDDLVDFLDIIGFDTIVVRDYPGSVYVEVTNADYPVITSILLAQARAAGVAGVLIYSTYPETTTWQLSSTYATSSTDASRGLGSSYVATGGRASGALIS